MNNFIRKRPKKIRENIEQNSLSKSSDKVFDFDKALEETNENTLIFPIDEDAINFGTWIQLYHPNFFEGGYKGYARFFLWLVYSIFVLCI